jgi:hypothetical protein
MPHRTYLLAGGLVGGQTLNEHLSLAHQNAQKIYGSITPLYLNPTIIHSTAMTGEGHPGDPLRPYFGHWMYSGGAGDSLVDLPGWGNETENRFVRPSPKWRQSPGQTHAKTFRVLAKKKIRTVSTQATPEWETFKSWWQSSAAENPETLDQWHAYAIEAIHSGYLPHYHEGYINAHNSGFTTGVFINSAWAEIANFFKDSDIGIDILATLKTTGHDPLDGPFPPHHTHLIDIYEPGVYPDMYNPKLNGWLYDADHHDAMSRVGFETYKPFYEKMGFHGTPEVTHQGTEGPKVTTQKQLAELIVIDEFGLTVPEEVIFLETTDIFYSNEAARKVMMDAGEETMNPMEAGNQWQLWSPKVNLVFAKHIRETYKNRTHAYGPSSVSKGINEYNLYTDSAFHLNHPRFDPARQSSVVNYSNLNYEAAVNILSDQQHLLIPNSYLLGQLAENKERFYRQFPDGTVANTIYGDLLTVGGIAKYSLDPSLMINSYAWYFDQNIGVDQYMQIWTQMVNPNENNSISVPSLEKPEGAFIFGFPKYKFLQEYRFDLFHQPWATDITINVPEARPADQFLKKIFNSEGEGSDPDPSQDQLMLFLMALAAGNPLVMETEENYWKREVDSKESIDTFSWDLTQFVGAWSSDDFAVESSNLLSFDFGIENTGWHDLDDDINGIPLPARNAFWEVTDKLKEFANTRSIYEILNAPLYDGKEIKVSPGKQICQPPGRSRCAPREKYGVHYDMNPFSHTEIMFYEIEKSKHGQIVQRFFIAAPTNLSGEASIEYIDSQIKLNEGYDYTIYTYVIVVGNEYQYQDIQGETINLVDRYFPTPEGATKTQIIDVELASSTQKRPPVATIYTINKPKIKLLKIPYIKLPTLYTADAPPLYPNMEIFPYQNINNKLLFLFSQYVGEREDVPIPILPGDEELFNKAKSAQGTSSEIIFKSDEPDYTYQIFRLEKHPIDWSDFSTALRKEMAPDKKDFIDNVSPNKKYYYMFRSTDRHGYVSNPSPIFEVELIDDSGAIYLSNKIVDFTEKTSREKTKSMKKYVHIVPTIKQSNLSAPEAASIYDAESKQDQDVILGPLFGRPRAKKFKVRITSKSSGKMFDLNLNFVHSHEGLGYDLKPKAPID